MKTTRSQDPVAEVRRIREAQSARLGNDPQTIVSEAMQRQGTGSRRLLDLRKRRKLVASG